jgi:hypothetical protein
MNRIKNIFATFFLKIYETCARFCSVLIDHMHDLIVMVGVGLIFYGFFLLLKWLAFVVLGSLLLVLGLLMARAQHHVRKNIRQEHR